MAVFVVKWPFPVQRQVGFVTESEQRVCRGGFLHMHHLLITFQHPGSQAQTALTKGASKLGA